MCRNGWCLDKTLHLISCLLEAVDAEKPTQEMLCVGLAEVLDASAAAYLCFDQRSQLMTIVCWPHSVDILRLKVALEHLPRAFPMLLTRILRESQPTCLSAHVNPEAWRGSVADLLLVEILGCHEVAQLPLHTSESQIRLVVLARGHDFSPKEMHFLRIAQRPLAALDRVILNFVSQSAGPTDAVVVPQLSRSEPVTRPALTRRETEVLTLLSDGLLARTIAARMEVSTRTVHKHLGSAYRKLEAHDRLLAVRRAQSMGLIPVQASS
jgi:DNA-binding CsgD family transcriptional regulator